MAERKTVRPVGRVYLDGPQPCPTCGGRLAPAFGTTEVDGRRVPYVDPNFAYCRDCGELFRCEEEATDKA